MSFTVNVLPDVTCHQPDEVIPFEDLDAARAKLAELGRDFVPASLSRANGPLMATNYPNPFAGTIPRREKALALWRARDPEWIRYSSTF